MRRFRAIFFDLFDTVVTFDTARLPTVRIGDRSHPSTADLLYDAVLPHLPALPVDRFRSTLRSLLATLRDEQLADLREISSDERFRRLLEVLEIDAPGLAERLTDLHMGALTSCVVVPEAHPRLLAALRSRYVLALVSNFDCARHGRALLERLGVSPLFDRVVISDEVGWRKPHPAPFLDPARALGLSPSEVLFVGDTPESDVVGALGAGMTACWLNPSRRPRPEGLPAPDLEVARLDDLRPLLLPA